MKDLGRVYDSSLVFSKNYFCFNVKNDLDGVRRNVDLRSIWEERLIIFGNWLVIELIDEFLGYIIKKNFILERNFDVGEFFSNCFIRVFCEFYLGRAVKLG